MKVAVIYDLTEPGGVQTCVFSLIKGLNRMGIIPTVFWDREPNLNLIRENRVEIFFKKIKFRFTSNEIKKNPDTLRYLLWPFNIIRISSVPSEFLFIYSFTPLILVDTLRPHLFYLSGPPLLPQLESHAFKFKLAKGFYKLFIRQFYPAYEPQQNAEYVINSNYTADIFAKEHGRDIDVIYPSNQLVIREPDKTDLITRDTVTFFSRIIDYKRPELLIELSDFYPTLHFVIMGSVSKNRLKYYKKIELIAKRKKSNNLEFYPNASRQKIDEVLSRTKFYFFPAINEHFGITTVEAIAKGCIPFVHNSGGQKEIVPIDELRFNDNELFEKFDKLSKYTAEQLNVFRYELFNYCQRFSEEIFIEKMLQKLPVK